MTAILREQIYLMLLALSFFTRIPVTLTVEITPVMLNSASRYFGLIGILLGACSALAFYLASFIFPLSVSLLIAMATSVLLTGAFHEDGWADVWDGFGGGWTVEHKLHIMKDSRLGTYGAAALFFILLIKYQSLVALSDSFYSVASAFVLAHCLSRVVATSLIYQMPYVREDANTKVKPLAQVLSTTSLMILLVTGLLVMSVLLSFMLALKLLVILAITRWLLMKWFHQQLGGYTGDCLGAAQQLSEVVIYLSLLIFMAEPL